jgi:acetate kinase
MPDVIGHRLVNGGPTITDHSRVDDEVMAELRQHQALAPIHNPPAIDTIAACRETFPGLPQVVISDTAFHSSIPDHARTYAIPRELSATLGIRKYGYHGISHQYVTTETARLMGIPLAEFSAVSCHLGSGGASLCAVVNGRSIDNTMGYSPLQGLVMSTRCGDLDPIDNTMGYSPLQGLVMSTRCGDLDPGVTLRLLAEAGGDRGTVEKQLNNRSGVLGLSGNSADIRDAFEALTESPTAERPQATTQVYLWRLKKYLGAYLTLVGRADAVIFTDTIGETVPEVREAVCSGMQSLGIRLDAQRNASPGPLPVDIAAADSRVRVWVVATNEEISIARSTYLAS